MSGLLFGSLAAGLVAFAAMVGAAGCYVVWPLLQTAQRMPAKEVIATTQKLGERAGIPVTARDAEAALRQHIDGTIREALGLPAKKPAASGEEGQKPSDGAEPRAETGVD